jgi:hypothetical protein
MLLNNGQFRENQEDVVRLPEDDPLTFACFVEWLYNQEAADTGRTFKNAFESDVSSDDDALAGFIDCRQEADDSNTTERTNVEDTRQEVKDKLSHLVGSSQANWESWNPPENSRGYDFSLQFSCYVLGDKLQASGFRDYIMFEIIYRSGDRSANLTIEQVIYVYSHTTQSNDRLRSFCINSLVPQDKGLQLSNMLNDRRIQQLCQEGGDVARDLLARCQKYATIEAARLQECLTEAQEKTKNLEKQLSEARTRENLAVETARSQTRSDAIKKVESCRSSLASTLYTNTNPWTLDPVTVLKSWHETEQTTRKPLATTASAPSALFGSTTGSTNRTQPLFGVPGPTSIFGVTNPSASGFGAT